MLRMILVTVFVLLVLAIRFLPVWLSITIGISLIVLSKFLARNFFLWLFSLAFRAKGKVLRRATVVVHRVTPTATPPDRRIEEAWEFARESRDPDDTDEDVRQVFEEELARLRDETGDDDEIPREFYELEVTITPQPVSGPFRHWDYTELALVEPNSRWDEDDESCDVISVDLVRAGLIVKPSEAAKPRPVDADADADEDEDEDADCDDCKVTGSQRLKMVVGVKPHVSELVFYYYFEKFGKVQLPS